MLQAILASTQRSNLCKNAEDDDCSFKETGFLKSRGSDSSYADAKKISSVRLLSESSHVKQLTPKVYYHSLDQGPF